MTLILGLWLLASFLWMIRHAARLNKLEETVRDLERVAPAGRTSIPSYRQPGWEPSVPAFTPIAPQHHTDPKESEPVRAAPIERPHEAPSHAYSWAYIAPPAAARPDYAPSPQPPPRRRVGGPPPHPIGRTEPEPIAVDESHEEAASYSVNWERWLGVRGAAALGAAILVVALLYFLRFSADQGWLTPTLRVFIGGASALACVAVAQLRFRTTHTVLSSWMTGAGVAGLYATVFAAQHAVGMIGPFIAFPAVVAITAACIALALRDDSVPIALLGLLGGFAAPLCLSFSTEQPYGVLAYLLVLDVTMVALAIKKRWWPLLVLSMLASAAYEALWLQSGGGAIALQVGVLTVFAGLFGAMPHLAPASEKGTAPSGLVSAARYGSLILPYLFAFMLMSNESSREPLATGAVALILSCLAAWIAVRHDEAGVLWVSLVGNSLLVFVLAADRSVSPVLTSGLVVGLTAPIAVAARFYDRTTARTALGVFLLVAALAEVMLVARSPESFGIVTLTLIGIGMAAGWSATFCRGALFARVSATVLPAVLGCVALVADGRTTTDLPRVAGVAAALLVLAANLAVGRARRQASPQLLAGARHGAILLMLLLPVLTRGSPALALTLIAVVMVMALATLTDARAFALIGVLVAFAVSGVAFLHPAEPVATFAVGVALLFGLYAAAPFALGDSVREDARVVRGLAPTLLFSTVAPLPAGLGIRPMNLAAFLAAAAAVGIVLLGLAERRAWRVTAGSWLGSAVTIASLSAVSLGLDGEWRIWGFCVAALLLLGLYTRTKHDTLGFAGLGSLVIAATMLVDPRVLSLHPRGAIPILNWITPVYLVPVAACVGAYGLLRDRSLRALPAGLGLSLLFVWCNVCVIDLFSKEAVLALGGPASEGRDLAISLVWGLYGVGLLAAGVRRNAAALRWASLGLALLTAGKVFLYDLSELRDLYRVAALLGLAGSLLAISLLYQRLVFKKVSGPTSA